MTKNSQTDLQTKGFSPSPNCSDDWVGIDGCRGGWIATHLSKKQAPKIYFLITLDLFLKSLPTNAVILVDMMLALNDKGRARFFDKKAKALLKKWHSRVFPAPPLGALAASTYEEACQYAYAISGKKISKQCYNLFPKIKALQAINDPRLIEYHPEIAFMQLNQGLVISESKKSTEGIQKRIELIEKQIPDFRAMIPLERSKPYAIDDPVDSAALALVAQSGAYKSFFE